MKNKAIEIAKLVEEAGGRAYFVGGFVRDKLLGIAGNDMEIEVHGLEPDVLYSILCKAGRPMAFGSSFGIYSLKGYDIDIAMPRKEHATGRGHRDFEVFVDPHIGPKEAARRRDFTVNAIMEDVLTGEILDPFGGKADLEAGVLRHVDDKSFPEDQLRVLRCAQFAARFGFKAAPETIELCRNIDLSVLSRERVEGELKKALLKSDKPSLFFNCLREMGQLSAWFPEAEKLIGIEQDPVYHPEGDVWVHTMEVLDRGAAYREKTENPYGFMLLCLTHDFGKIVATEFVNDRVHAYGHETLGQPIIEEFLARITSEKSITEYVLNMVPLHMKPNMAAYSRTAVKKTNKMFDDAASALDLVYFSMSDKPVFSGSDAFTGDPEFLFERLEVYKEIMARPWISGKDLVEAGLTPGKNFSEILEYAHKLRLADIEKASALKQVLAYARKLKD